MRILFLTSRLPYPPYRGDRLRAYHFLRALAQEHEITLVSFIAQAAERAHIPQLAPHCTAVHVVPLSARRSALAVLGNAWRRRPLQALYYRSKRMARLLDTLFATQQFDLAYAHLFRMAPYLENRRALYRIVDFTDLISLEVRASLAYRSTAWRGLYAVEWPRLAAYEEQVAGWADEIWFINERDRAAFATRPHHAALHVIPNLIHLTTGADTAKDAIDDILFTGNLDVPHNRDAIFFLLEEIMPLVWRELPEATVSIAGAGDAAAIAAKSRDSRVRVTGFLPDLGEAYARSRVFAAPLRFAAGTQNKVLEAMAAGLPVVTTPVVYEGLDAGGTAVTLQAAGAQEFAALLVDLLRDPLRRAEVGAAGRRFVNERYADPVVVQHMRGLVQKLGS